MTEPYRTSVEIAAPPEEVYPFFIKPDAILRWMGDYAVLDPRPDGEFTLDVNGTPIRGRYIELDPPHRLVISWGHAGSTILPPGASTLEITLTPIPSGTLVSLEHRDLPEEEAVLHAVGWPNYLARLAIAGGGGDPGPDPFAEEQPPAATRRGQ